MKDVGRELRRNIDLLESEEYKIRDIERNAVKEALELLIQTLKDTGYNPTSIGITTKRVILWKKEITVRFLLHTIGFTFNHQCKNPEIIVHLRKDGSNYINPVILQKLLNILVDPRYWKENA